MIRGRALRCGTVIEVQEVRIAPEVRRVWVAETEVVLSRLEFDLLRFLMERAGKIVTREVIMREVWDTAYWKSSRTIDVHLGWVRRKLGDNPRRPRLITTVRGQGLRFEAWPPMGADPARQQGR